MGQYRTWTLDSGLDRGLDCGLNNGPDNWTRISIAWGQMLCVINQQQKACSSVSCRIYVSQHTVDYILSLQESSCCHTSMLIHLWYSVILIHSHSSGLRKVLVPAWSYWIHTQILWDHHYQTVSATVLGGWTNITLHLVELLDVTSLTEVEQMSKIPFLASQAMLFVLFSDLAKPHLYAWFAPLAFVSNVTCITAYVLFMERHNWLVPGSSQ